MRPFATNLEIKFAGVDVTDVEPTVLPNLYFGAPVKVFGRYRGSGTANVTLRGSVSGVKSNRRRHWDFPKTDLTNPGNQPHVGLASSQSPAQGRRSQW